MLERSQHVVDGLRGTLNTRCSEDKWPAEVLTCFSTVKKREEIQGCITRLPKDQADKATSDIMKTMTNGLNLRMRPSGGTAMGSAHGMPLVGGQPLPDVRARRSPRRRRHRPRRRPPRRQPGRAQRVGRG